MSDKDSSDKDSMAQRAEAENAGAAARNGAGEPAAESHAPLGPEEFYMEDGFLVFTAAYHLRRGYCCNSGCRHCPYEELNE